MIFSFKMNYKISTQSFFFFFVCFSLLFVHYQIPLIFVWASVVVNYDPYITATLEMLYGVFGYPGISLYDSV